MAGRQGVHISYLIVTMVISLGLIVYVVLTNSELQQARDAQAKAEKEVESKNGTIKTFKSEIDAMRRLLTGTDVDQAPIEDIQSTLDGAGNALAAAKGQTGGGERHDNVTALITELTETVKRLHAESVRQTTQADSYLDKYQKALAEKAALESAKNEELDGVRSEYNQTLAQLESTRTSTAEEIEKLRDQIATMADEHSDEVQDLNTNLLIKVNKIIQLEERIRVIEREINQERTFADVTPDGEILRVSEEEGYAWINIGRDDRVRRGLVFDVFTYVKGGRKLRKGRVEVARLEGDYAEVRILDQIDRFNPISAGDQIASPFYNKDTTPVFVIAGEELHKKGISKEEVVRRIEQFGGQVEDDVRVETTYVVAASGYQDTPQYRTARELGVTILRESELMEFIGF
ncbi:MAG: hypothetical protein KDC38_05265 [Planctomycetes bacterium]|nr:hypothetical protein [Planctomycetota bacterium]